MSGTRSLAAFPVAAALAFLPSQAGAAKPDSDTCMKLAADAAGGRHASRFEKSLGECREHMLAVIAGRDDEKRAAVVSALEQLPIVPPVLLDALQKSLHGTSMNGPITMLLRRAGRSQMDRWPPPETTSLDCSSTTLDAARAAEELIEPFPREPLFATVTLSSSEPDDDMHGPSTMTATVYRVGRFRGGEYAGRELLSVFFSRVWTCEADCHGGMTGVDGAIHRYVDKDGKHFVRLPRLSDTAERAGFGTQVRGFPSLVGVGSSEDARLRQPRWGPAAELSLNGTCLAGLDRAAELPAGGRPERSAHPLHGQVLRQGPVFWVSLPDGMAASYYFKPPERIRPLPGGDIFRCDRDPGKSAESLLDLVGYASESAVGELVFLSTHPALGPIWAPADYKDPVIRGMRDAWVDAHGYWAERARESGRLAPPLYSEAEYLGQRPGVYWRNRLGQLMLCLNEDFINPQMAEPVLYLYPPSARDVSVELGPGVRLIASRPRLEGRRWRVRAHPDGRLVDVEGREHPHLFWEGSSYPIPRTGRGDVVARGELDRYFDRTLEERGLSVRETADFKAYWLSRMQEAPYYRVDFLDERDMSFLAPLDIDPRPDTLIRVLMDYEPLSRRIEVPPAPRPVPRVRRGFTAVEWGGVLR